jgi:hypothetical protein
MAAPPPVMLRAAASPVQTHPVQVQAEQARPQTHAAREMPVAPPAGAPPSYFAMPQAVSPQAAAQADEPAPEIGEDEPPAMAHVPQAPSYIPPAPPLRALPPFRRVRHRRRRKRAPCRSLRRWLRPTPAMRLSICA